MKFHNHYTFICRAHNYGLSVGKFWAIILDMMAKIYFKGFANTSVMMSLKTANENFALKVQTTLNMIYKQRCNLGTSWSNLNFDSRCLSVAYFGLKS